MTALTAMTAAAASWLLQPDAATLLKLGVGLGAVVLGVAGIAAKVRRSSASHGRARWATGAQRRRAGLHGRTGLVLGRVGDRVLVSDGADHVLVCAPTRTGKGVSFVIPNLLSWSGSVIVLDMKRENFRASAGFRKAAGQTIHVFDPLDREGRTARYNPLAHIDRANPVEVVDELQRLGLLLFPSTSGADAFWAEAARVAFLGVGAYVAASPERPFSLGEVLRQATLDDPKRRLPRAIEDRRRAGAPLPAPYTTALMDFCGASENTFSSIRQTLSARLNLFVNPLADAATAGNDFDLRDLRAGRMSLYLCASPETLDRSAPLFSLLFQQMIDLNCRRLPPTGSPPILVLLDEFARLGAMPGLAHAFSWVGAYGLRLSPVIQSQGQLTSLYGPHLAQEIVANCGVELFFAPKDQATAATLSQRLGRDTRSLHSFSRPVGLGSGRRSITVATHGRPLLLPQEVTALPADDMLIFKSGCPPVRARRLIYHRENVFRCRLRPPPDLSRIAPAPTPPRAAKPGGPDIPVSGDDIAWLERALVPPLS